MYLIKKPVLILLLTPFLTHCTLSNSKNELLQTQELLMQQQQEWMEEQSSQLDALLTTQETMSEQISSLQTQVVDLRSMVESKTVVVGKSARKKMSKATVITEPHAVYRDNKIVLGRVEWVWLEKAKKQVKARIDTGTAYSSLKSSDIQPFERDGSDWVRFTLLDSDAPVLIETPLLRYRKIKSNGSVDRRPVVALVLQFGDLSEEGEFTLNPNNHMLYPITLGRNFLRDIAVVDVAKKFIQPKVEVDVR